VTQLSSRPLVVARLLRSASVVLVAGLACALAPMASAQTAPQLLPYTARLIAGGGTSTTTCASGLTSTDLYGDGCLATEISPGNNAVAGKTPGARKAVADAAGNVFFSDYQAALVRRVDAVTGVVTAVAGGGAATAGTSSGLQGTAVKLSHPLALAFAPNGDLYFSDTGNGQVFKITATGGSIPATGGIITLVAGNATGTYGYAASNATSVVTVANSFLRAPYGIAFDTKGDLFIVDEYTEAIVVLNTSLTTNTVNTVTVLPGQIVKIAGAYTPSGGSLTSTCPNGSATPYGCSYAVYTENVQANSDEFDSTYGVAVDPNTGTVYAANEYYDSIFQVTSAGVLSTYAGIQNKVGTKPTIGNRAVAGSFGVGSPFGVTADANSNVYFTDASSGVVWRVDGAGKSQYVVAGGATVICGNNTDAYGDGCPATQAIFGSSGTGNYATTTLPGPGIYGVTVDAYSDLFIGDTETNLVREVASGTQFGPVGANSPVDILDIHFAAGDTPAGAGAYTITAGQTNFSVPSNTAGATAALGSPSCTTNSDKSTDCLVPLTATPTALGGFTGTLQVTSTLGTTATFPLSGTYVQTPLTRTSVSFTTGSTCSTTTTISTNASVTLNAQVSATGAPGGTVQFYANGAAIGKPATLTNNKATTTYTFATPGTYTITAVYSGDSYFKTSTGKATGTITSSAPTVGALTVVSNAVITGNPPQTCGVGTCTVKAGGTGLYAFTIAQNVYSGTISFTCSGLPSGAACVFYPPTITNSGCSQTSTVALSITTSQPLGYTPDGPDGRGRLGWLSAMMAMLLALGIGLRRRRSMAGLGAMALGVALLVASSGLIACGGTAAKSGTPTGTSMVTVTATSTTGTTSTATVTLVVQ
jgi:hypothetical protein